MNSTEKPLLLLPHDSLKDDNTIQSLQQKYKKASLLKKLISISAFFLNRPYLLGALGEGEKGSFDQSPLYRMDGFDCVTFVNTVLALTLSQSLTEFKKQMIAINYLGHIVAYPKRCHFISLDWNRNNSIDHPILKDITQTIRGENQQPLSKTANALIDKNCFFQSKTLKDIKLKKSVPPKTAQKLLKELQHSASNIKPEWVSTPYLPIACLFNNEKLNESLFNQLPTAFIIEMIRPNWNLTNVIGTHLNVSHLGFCFKKGNTWTLRHASSQHKKIVDVQLSTYLSQYKNHETLKGINIQKIASL